MKWDCPYPRTEFVYCPYPRTLIYCECNFSLTASLIRERGGGEGLRSTALHEYESH